MIRSGFKSKERKEALHFAIFTLRTGNLPLFPERAEEHLKLLTAFSTLEFINRHNKSREGASPSPSLKIGGEAGRGTRTPDLRLGKPTFYH